MVPQFEALQQRYFTIPDILDATPSGDEVTRVSAILDSLLDSYSSDPEAEVPGFAAIFNEGPIARVSSAASRWLSTTKWTEAIDLLLEKSFPFEAKLADEIAAEKRRIQVEMELRPGGAILVDDSD